MVETQTDTIQLPSRDSQTAMLPRNEWTAAHESIFADAQALAFATAIAEEEGALVRVARIRDIVAIVEYSPDSETITDSHGIHEVSKLEGVMRDTLLEELNLRSGYAFELGCEKIAQEAIFTYEDYLPDDARNLELELRLPPQNYDYAAEILPKYIEHTYL